jgi:thiol-disulfide isomerase/thioredoxin
MKWMLIIFSFLFFQAKAQTGMEILNRTLERIKRLKDITYNIYSEMGNEKITANVVIKRGPPLPIFDYAMIKVSGIAVGDTGSRQINFAYNGSSFDFVNPITNQMVKLDSPSYSKLGRTGVMNYTFLVLSAYWQKEPFGTYATPDAQVENLGDTLIYKVPCYKLRLAVEKKNTPMGPMKLESIWFIGKNDSLIYGNRLAHQEQFLHVLSIDKGMSDDNFVLARSPDVKRITGREPLSNGLLPVGNNAPLWSLPSSTGKPISLESLRGNIVLLDFWGTWCIPCIRAMPDIQAIHEHFLGQPVVVIGISVEPENKADPVGFAKSKGYTYPIALKGTNIANDYRVVEFPTVYLIDKTGKVIHAEHSGGRENFKEDIIHKIANELQK